MESIVMPRGRCLMLRFGWRLWDVGCVGKDEQKNPDWVTWELLHGRYFAHSATAGQAGRRSTSLRSLAEELDSPSQPARRCRPAVPPHPVAGPPAPGAPT